MSAKSRINRRLIYPVSSLLSKTFLGNDFTQIAEQFVDVSRGFSYDIQKNGESGLVKKVLRDAALKRTLSELRAEKSGNKNLVVFDVGANRGDWTNEILRFAQQESVQLHLFEISSNLASSLKKRFESEGFIKVHNIGLSNSVGFAKYAKYPESEEYNSLLVTSTLWNELEREISTVPTLTGNIFCANHNIQFVDLVKIDVEGWEWHVLKGFEEMLCQQQIGIVQFEYGYPTGDTHVLMKDFFNLFGDFGYMVGPLRKRGVQFRDFIYKDNDFKSGPNYVAALGPLVSSLEFF